MSGSDFLCINDHKLFKKLFHSIGTNCDKTLNILAERHNILYAWNKEENSVLTMNIKAARDKEESALNYQTLLPHSPPYFALERLIVNETNTILIATGPNGVLVFELPDRTPPFGNFSNNKEVIFCRTYSLLENILSFSSTVECRQVRFHPGSPTDSHFLGLTSDNIIRLFSLENSAVFELAIYPLGPKPTGKIPDRNLSFLDALGDLAVDFDFSTPSVDIVKHPKPEQFFTIGKGDGKSPDEQHGQQLLWSIFILYGNGLICKMIINYEGEKCHPDLLGPLSFKNFPSGNLSDFCSIICVPTTPPILAIAHCDGNLYHGLELPCTEELNLPDRPIYCKSPNTALYLFEIIEVEFGLSTSSIVDATSYTCPIFLKRDLGKLGSYYAVHNTGVHSVNIMAVEGLNHFIINDDYDSEVEEAFTKPSSAQYLICTKTGSTEKLNPLLGICIINEPHSIITFLANGKVITLDIKDHFYSFPVASDKLDETEIDFNSSSLINKTTAFDVYINSILKKSTSQPILQADSNTSEPPQEVCYEVLQRAGKIFREEHFVNLTKAREEMDRRSKQLKILQEFQISVLTKLNKERETLQTNAENIAEKYEDLKEKQEEYTKRCQILLGLVSRKQTEPSIAEEKYFENLQSYDKKIDGFIKAMEKLKDKVKYQRNQMVHWKRENQQPEQLFPGQCETIRENLADTTKKIAEITAEMKEYMNKLNIK